MPILNVLFMLLTAKWIIEAEKYSFAWYISGICFVLNTLAVLTHLENIF